jgi:pimeloyl-ACP methyl ester carboxylesterase
MYYKFIRFFSISVLAFLFLSCSKQENPKVISIDHVKINYETRGSGVVALIFVHGWSCDLMYWENQVPEFAKEFQVVTIDLGGHGKSGIDRKNWTIEAYGQDVAAVVNQLELEKVILIGHSMGGFVNIEAGKLLGDKVIGLIGVDTYQDITTEYSDEMKEMFLGNFRKNFIETAKEFVREMFPEGSDSVLVSQVVSDMSSAEPKIAISSMENLFHYDAKSALKNFTIPVRAVNADLWPTDQDGNRNYMPSFEVKFMKGYGHFIMLENPKLFNSLLHETITELLI